MNSLKDSKTVLLNRTGCQHAGELRLIYTSKLSRRTQLLTESWMADVHPVLLILKTEVSRYRPGAEPPSPSHLCPMVLCTDSAVVLVSCWNAIVYHQASENQCRCEVIIMLHAGTLHPIDRQNNRLCVQHIHAWTRMVRRMRVFLPPSANIKLRLWGGCLPLMHSK